MQAPERLGKYLIRRELGRGAMGVVYEGYDPLIERPVAIKVLRIDEANAQLDAELRLRFRREAQAAGRLSHPNIVSVYEYGEEAGSNSAFIAMELVEGRDLKSLFDDGHRFSLAEAGRLMGELLGALQHAHERGVVHRDIKPANIILLADGSVKVADFGIAKLDTSELTQLGSVLGTVSHMSPEQLTGETVDRRSDLFSCGVILYQLLTGARAFTGSPATVMHRVLHEHPAAPSSVDPGLPRSLDAVIGKAMAKAPADRFATADAFAAALRGAIAAVATPAAQAADPDATLPTARRAGAGSDADATVVLPRPTATPARTSRPPALLGAGALGLVVAGAAAYFVLGPTTSPPPERDVAGTAKVANAASAVGGDASAAPTAAASVTAATVTAATPTSAPVAAAASVVAASVGPSADAIEQEAWEDALKINTAAAFEAYLKGYPKGRYAARARVRLAALAPKPPPAASAAPPAPAPTVATAPAPTRPTAPPVLPPRTEARPTDARPTEAKPTGPSTPTSPPATMPGAQKPAPPAVATASAPPSARPPAPGAAKDPAKAAPPPTGPAPTTTAKAAGGAPAECADDAQRRSARCQVALGHMHRNGNGVPRDPAEAARWYRKAADQGHDIGQYELARLYETGQGVVRDPVEAVAWLRKAADQGLARAQNRLGFAYESGLAGPANFVLASDWYRKAADQGNPDAQTNLARLYLRGRGVFKDVAKATELAQKAADQGDPNAYVVLAGMYQSGEGKPRDPARATRLYRDALASPGLSARSREIAQAALATRP